ncbi:hypothetical protein PVAP13_6NG171600 [Panicum virgatum]|uniref:Uncharacterized protein n=1 Tax=Panicum virgatum TaxID=38727 RepID=A0A8T0QXD9_PANVG|nr:hypothetical protein PVAP13_6NG171600 [Panicum virgatum]
MLDIAKREFDALAVDGSNYLMWAIDIEIKLDEAGKDERTKPDKARTLHFLRHHLHLDLKSEYMTERDPLVLWQSLKDRFSQQIVTKMRLCCQKITNADMIEKTLSTFHAGDIVLQQQYKNSKYTKYSELSEVLSVAKQQNEVLINNHSVRPTGSMAVLEAHANVAESSRNHKRARGKGKWKGKRGAMFKGKGNGKPKGRAEPKKEKGYHSGEEQGEWYRCGTKGHWSRKGQHESHFTTEPEAQKRDDMNIDANGEDVQMEENEDNLLDDFDIFGDL